MLFSAYSSPSTSLPHHTFQFLLLVLRLQIVPKAFHAALPVFEEWTRKAPLEQCCVGLGFPLRRYFPFQYHPSLLSPNINKTTNLTINTHLSLPESLYYQNRHHHHFLYSHHHHHHYLNHRHHHSYGHQLKYVITSITTPVPLLSFPRSPPPL